MRSAWVVLLLAVLLGMCSAAFVVWRGLYDVSATGAHTQPVYKLLEVAMQQSVKLRSAGISPPDLSRQPVILRGAACFRDWCVQCHGAPGVAPSPIGLSLQPLPGSLIDAGRRWRPEEMYWITKHGIKMSGMPAWQFRLSDEDIWAVTAFLTRLPALSPRDYRSMAGQAPTGEPTGGAQQCSTIQGACSRPPCPPSPPGTQSLASEMTKRVDVPMLFRQYACTACHVIPGVSGSDLHVGPALKDLGRRSLIAGKLSNTEESLVRWIRFPQQVDPETAMPDAGVTEAHARQMARYLLQAH